ncbi:choline O-acetyltransferase [Trichonephila clavipes]|nr:choline O-acetyltransferase [Trichonephila clavipes]
MIYNLGECGGGEKVRIGIVTHLTKQRFSCLLAPNRAIAANGVLLLKGYVKSLVYADKPQTLDHLEDNIHRVIADIRPQMLEKVIENWTTRLDYIRASRDSHMPEIIFKMFAAKIILFALNYKKKIDSNELPPDTIPSRGGKSTILCMDTYHHFFPAYRKPGEPKDELIMSHQQDAKHAWHVVVACKNQKIKMSEDLSKFKKKRTAVRSSLTKLINKIEGKINNENEPVDQFEAFIEQLNDKESNLSLLNTLIEDRLSVDTITEDMEASEEIKEKIIFWKTKLFLLKLGE